MTHDEKIRALDDIGYRLKGVAQILSAYSEGQPEADSECAMQFLAEAVFAAVKELHDIVDEEGSHAA